VRRVETRGDRRRHAENDGKELTGVESETTNRSTEAPSVVQSPSKNRMTQRTVCPSVEIANEWTRDYIAS
jgi:hypothetical protein